jgi:hypothetical protein
VEGTDRVERRGAIEKLGMAVEVSTRGAIEEATLWECLYSDK